MYSAFGVDHHGVEISKKKEARFTARLLPMAQRGAEQLGLAARRTVSNPKNKDVPLKDMKTPFINELSDAAPVHGAIETGRRLAADADVKAATGLKNKVTTAANKATVGDLAEATTVRRINESPANLFRGKKTVTTTSNPLTGANTRQTTREGGRFFKEKDVIEAGGQKIDRGGKKGGLTTAGKVTFVGGGGAGAGLGGIALNEKLKRSSY